MTPRRRRPSRSEEVEKLRAQLAEAELTLDAIRRGEVDALVVHDEHGERIYSLTSAELPYRLLIEQMQEGAVTVDADGEILYANARFAGMVGLPLERVIGQSIRRFLEEGKAQAVTDMISTGTGRHELRIVGVEGMTIPGFVSATPLQIGGVSCVGLIVTDLTLQKHHEERLELLAREQQARGEAEAANRAKDEFLAVLSHELRTPLNAILGWARVLRTQGVAPTLSAHALEVIERNGLVQVRMVEDLLEISRVITGKMRLDARPVEMASVVDTAVESMAPAARAKSITLATRLAPDTGLVLADAQRMQQVVWNLLSNAIKFTPPGGHVGIVLDRHGDIVRLTVQDTGEGMDAALLPHIFERFRQGDSSSTRVHGGLGIGLALVRHLMEVHGGTASAASEGKGRGSTFTVELPVLRSAADAPVTPGVPERGKRLRGLRVVVVDNDRDTVDLIETILRAHDMDVRSYASVSDALEAVASWNAQLVISEIQMPTIDGYELIARLRTGRERNRRVPTIALTTANTTDDARRAYEAGFDMHIGKPFEPSDLLATIEKLAAVA